MNKLIKKLFCILFVFFTINLFSQTLADRGYAEEEFRRGVQAYYRGSFNDAILQFEKALTYVQDEGLILYWLGKAYYRSGLESAAIQQWEFAHELGYGGQLLQNTIEIVKTRRNLTSSFTINERYVESTAYSGSKDSLPLFSNPVGLLTMPDGSLWISAYSSNELVRYDANGVVIERKKGPLNGFDRPMDLLQTKAGNVYVAEYAGDRISVLDKNFNYLFSFGSKGRGNGNLLGPQFLAQDQNENIFVTDFGNARVAVFDKDGNHLFNFGKFISPVGIAIKDDTVFVGDSVEGCIYCYDLFGNYKDMLVLEETFEKLENFTVIDDYLVVADSNKIYAVNINDGSVNEIANVGNAPTKLISTDIDSNGNLVALDFTSNEILLLSKMSELIGGLYVEITRVNADNFPQVTLEVNVENRRREPVVGLKENNFLITENNYSVANQTYLGTVNQDSDCDITVIIDRSLSMKAFESEVSNAIKQIAAAMNGKGNLRVVCAGSIPATELVSNPSFVTSFQMQKLQTEYASYTNTDLAIRLASNELINAELKRAIIYITNSDNYSRRFNNYSLQDLSNYLNNNHISFSTICVDNKALSEDVAYITQNTKGSSFYIYRPTGIAEVVEEIRSFQSGIYMFSYTSALPTDFGRNFLNVEIESYLHNRSGRDETGYYSPLQ